jgi:paraquat-inducible protein A
MIITQLTGTQGYTIMGGIVELEQSGLWPLALLVFFASVTIPLLKLLLMTYILLTTRAGGTEHLVGRTAAYRFIDFIGRWSMIDVFMVSILVALVRFGHFANVHAALGAAYFAAVVVVTIFAVEAFDSRLMWDAQDKGKAA